MEKLRVTIIGQDIFKEVAVIFEDVGLRVVNQINSGMLGNLKGLTYVFELEEEKVIDTRKNLMKALTEYGPRFTAMYVHGDWMRIFIFKSMSLRF